MLNLKPSDTLTIAQKNSEGSTSPLGKVFLVAVHRQFPELLVR